MTKRTISCILLLLLTVGLALPTAASAHMVGETSHDVAAQERRAADPQAGTLAAQFLGLGRGTLALYAASGVFVIVGLCLVKKHRSTALLVLVLAGLLAYVGYSVFQQDVKRQQEAAQAPATAPPAAETVASADPQRTGAPAVYGPVSHPGAGSDC